MSGHEHYSIETQPSFKLIQSKFFWQNKDPFDSVLAEKKKEGGKDVYVLREDRPQARTELALSIQSQSKNLSGAYCRSQSSEVVEKSSLRPRSGYFDRSALQFFVIAGLG